jgi:hypothetical protein
MFYTPPSLPVPIYHGDDCKKGSRDCFPENTQGGAIQNPADIWSGQQLEDLSCLVPNRDLIPNVNRP